MILEKINKLSKINEEYNQKYNLLSKENSNVYDIDLYIKNLENTDVKCKRYIINNLIDKVIWDGENAHIYFREMYPLCENSK